MRSPLQSPLFQPGPSEIATKEEISIAPVQEP